jgi:cytochrome c553
MNSSGIKMRLSLPLALAVLSLVLSLGSPTAIAGSFEYDVYEGEDINRVCAACHGEYGQGGGGGSYPRLAGLPQKYMAEQVQEFKDRKRINIPMLPFANDRELSDEDVFNITTYLSKIKLKTRVPKFPEGTDALIILQETKRSVQIPSYPGDVEKGEALYQESCALCHGKTGQGRGKRKPPLVGQFSEYLLKQIITFKEKERDHQDREETFDNFSLEDAKNVIAYLATLDD